MTRSAWYGRSVVVHSCTPQGGEGYGSKLLNRSVTGQLGGSIKTDWSDEGIIVTVTMNAAKLST